MPPIDRLRPLLASITLLSAATLLFALPLKAWGPLEHRVVARLAQERIASRAKMRSGLLFSKGVKFEDLALQGYAMLQARPDAEPWRSITIPPGAKGLDLRRDCPIGDCVTAKLREQIGIVRLSIKEKPAVREAAQYALALAADLHQPLNVGYPPGTVGDGSEVMLRGEPTTLHEVWESQLFADEQEEALTERIRARIASSDARQWSRGTLKAWTWDTHQTAVQVAYAALPDGSPAVLDEDYLARARDAAEIQLAKAAVRLAAIIDDMWP